MRIISTQRPWGEFRQFTHNESSTVKIITVSPGEELSLQFHHKRTEFWRVLRGEPVLTIGDQVIEAKEGDEFEIKEGVQHRIKGGNTVVQILEISLGDFDENDIVRLQDRYGRVA